MSRLSLALFLAFFLLIHQSRQQSEPEKILSMFYGCTVNITLPEMRNGEAVVRQLTIAPAFDLVFNITNIPANASFLILQIHTHLYNVTLSYDKENLNKALGKSVFGSNIGLFIDGQLKTAKSMYLRNDNIHAIDALLVITAYGYEVPIPGGCNMEFETEIAPYMRLKPGNDLITIDMQPASLPTLMYPKFTCDRTSVKHTVYQMFLPEYDFSAESYFAAIQKMLTVENIVKNGREMSPGWRTPMRRFHSAYIGVGSIYVAVSSYKNYTSAFVPTFSYACSPVLYPDSCEMLNGVIPKFVCAVAVFFGIFTIFFGRKCCTANNFIPAFFIGCVIAYSLAKNASLSVEINLTLAMIGGILAGLLRYIIISYRNTEALQSTNHSIAAIYASGLFLASGVYLHLPDVLRFNNDFAFWTLFLAMIVFFSCMTACMNYMGLLVASAIFGSTFTVLSIDYYTPSCLKYILINIIRRATVPDFDVATVYPPYQTADIWMTVLWCFLGLYGLGKLVWPTGDPVSRLTARTPFFQNSVPTAPRYDTFFHE